VLGHAAIGFLRGGFVGVDVFFVLSGFLITGLLLSDAGKHGSVSLREFYARRAKRILPAAALTLIVTDIAANYLLNFVRAKQAVLDSVWAAFFSANVHFASQGVDYFSQGQPPSPVQHYWSLAVEEQFYLVWPILLSLVLVGVSLHRRRVGRRVDPAEAAKRKPRWLAIVIAVVGFASLAWSIYQTPRVPAAAYFSTTARAWELALGAVLAIGASRFGSLSGKARVVMGWVGVSAIGVAAVQFSETTPFPGYAALLPTLGTALVIAAGIGDHQTPGGVGRILGRAALRYVGDRSYAFYLWHWPVLVIASQYVGHDLSAGVNLLLLGGAFLLSIASYRLIEDPIRRATSIRPIGTSAVLWGTSVVLVVLVATVSLHSIGPDTVPTAAADLSTLPVLAPDPEISGSTEVPVSADAVDSLTSRAIPAVVKAVRKARQRAEIPWPLIPPPDLLLDDKYLDPDGCDADPEAGRTSSRICTLGASGATKSIVLFGDSHAREWMPPILRMASEDGWAVIPVTADACWPSRWLGRCRRWYRWALHQVETLHPDVILIGGRFVASGQWGTGDAVAEISTLVEEMKRVSKNVIVIGDPPGLGREPVDCLLARKATLSTCAWAASDDQLSLYLDVGRATQSHGAAFLDTVGWFCFEKQCPMVVDRTIVYRDDRGHVTQTYALELRALFRHAFKRALIG
jgi:peptidoglycan/LPS O-acetylase OafA/YrhL